MLPMAYCPTSIKILQILSVDDAGIWEVGVEEKKNNLNNIMPTWVILAKN